MAGGQLGKMLALAASNWDVKTYVLDPTAGAPASSAATRFVRGSYTDFESVYKFGQLVDMITFEIENVDITALRRLKTEGVTIHPDPDVLAVIQDKGLQKLLYSRNGIPTADFQMFDDEHAVRQAVTEGRLTYPFVQKSRLAGYDGKGVAVIRNEEDLANLLLEGGCIIEEMVKLQKELAVIVARNTKGEVTCYPSVEMEFNEEANLVEQLVCPANIDAETEQKASELAKQVVGSLDLVGILAVELFLDENGELLVNEVAPRPHNSGHHTIEGLVTSQYEQQLRAILGFPLGSTEIKMPSVMINLLGEPGFEGPVRYEGLEDAMAIPGVKVHIYGKKETRPFRKMGHVTILSSKIEDAKEKAQQVKQLLKVKSWQNQ